MSGLEIVYTVHKFEAENVDEISINVGEQVIVLEKDEGFNDGWWQGRNIRGEVGLFPITYTSKQPPPVSMATKTMTTNTTKTLENKIDSLENVISKMKPANISTTNKTIQNNVNQSIQKRPPVEEWTSEQVASWLIEIGFDQELANNFKDQEISGDILLELTLDSLKELNVTTFGKRFKIHSAINVLKKQKLAAAAQQQQQQQPNNNNAQNDMIARVASPFPDLLKSNKSNNAAAISSYYNSNKQQNAYMDDDLVSDYSTVIRNSRAIQPPTEAPAPPKSPPTRPSIPLDMDLIASSPRLSTLVERQGSISSVQSIHDNNVLAQQQQQRQQLQLQQQRQQQQQRQLQLEQQQRQQQREQQQLRQQQQQQQSRPISHQVVPTHHPQPSNSTSMEWKRNTMNHIKPQQQEEESRISTSSRYSFMRQNNNNTQTNNKLQSIIPNTNMVRRSEDVATFQELSASPDMEGWLYKQGDKYKTWNKRWFVLKTNNLFYFKSPKAVRMKGIINLKGYRIEVDESIQPGKYCFKAHHERERTFYFYTDFEKSMKDWLKALMKATIARDFATPVMSSSTIPTVSLEMARRMRPRPPSTIFHQKGDIRAPTPSMMNNNNYRIQNNLGHHFSMMALQEEEPLPQPQQKIMSFAHQQQVPSRAPSQMSIQRPSPPQQQQQQQRVMSPDNMSEYSTRFKDSGFNSAHGLGTNLTRSITESSGHSSTITRKSSNSTSLLRHQHQQQTSPGSVVYYPDEEDEDLIDPEHMSVIHSNMHQPSTDYQPPEQEEEDEEDIKLHQTLQKKQYRYVDWVNSMVQYKLNNITDVCTGEALLELLEQTSGKEIMRPMTNPSQAINVQRMDRIIAAFKFMSLEGIELDGLCTVRDILNGNTEKIMYMLDAIKYWQQQQKKQQHSPQQTMVALEEEEIPMMMKPVSTNGGGGNKKMASGGTFGEEDQDKLRQLEQQETESILPAPNQPIR